jgi:hypothetical protein
MTWINDADAVGKREPYPSVRGLSDKRTDICRRCTAPDSVGLVEHLNLDSPSRVGDPCVHVRPRNAHQSTCHVQPDGVIVVLRHPVHGIAGQSVVARKRCNPAVLCRDLAEPAFSCGPERAVLVELEGGDLPSPQSIGTRVRCADLTILKILDATRMRSKPEPAPSWIGNQRKSAKVVLSESRPRDVLNCAAAC